MNLQNKSYPATALFFGRNYLGSFDPGISTVTAMVKKWWKKQQEQYIPLPRCPDIKITPSTPTELKEVNAEALNQSLISAGQQTFLSALQKAKALQKKRIQLRRYLLEHQAGLCSLIPFMVIRQKQVKFFTLSWRRGRLAISHKFLPPSLWYRTVILIMDCI